MTNESQTQSSDDLIHWSFDQWRELYLKNPTLYEQFKKQLLMQFVEDAPNHQKDRLKGLLFTMEGEKRRSQSVAAEQVRYYALMMDSLADLNDHLSSLLELKQCKKDFVKKKAKILEFKKQK